MNVIKKWNSDLTVVFFCCLFVFVFCQNYPDLQTTSVIMSVEKRPWMVRGGQLFRWIPICDKLLLILVNPRCSFGYMLYTSMPNAGAGSQHNLELVLAKLAWVSQGFDRYKWHDFFHSLWQLLVWWRGIPLFSTYYMSIYSITFHPHLSPIKVCTVIPFHT